MSNMMIYEIDKKISEVLFYMESCVDEEGNILDDEAYKVLSDKMNELQLSKDAIVDSICSHIKNLEGKATAIKAEADNLVARAKKELAKAETQKKALAKILEEKNFENERHKVSFRKTTSVDIADENAIPEEFLKVKYTPDKTSIKKALQAGENISGAMLVQKNSMSVK